MNNKQIFSQLEVLTDASVLMTRDYRNFYKQETRQQEIPDTTELLIGEALMQVQSMVANVIQACGDKYNIEVDKLQERLTETPKETDMNSFAVQLWWSVKYNLVEEEFYETMSVIQDVEKRMLKEVDMSLIPEQERDEYTL